MARYLEIPQVVAGIAAVAIFYATAATTEVVSTVQKVVKTVT